MYWKSSEMRAFWLREGEDVEFCNFLEVQIVDTQDAIIEMSAFLPEGIRFNEIKRGDIIEVLKKSVGEVPYIYLDSQAVMRCRIIKILIKEIENLAPKWASEDDYLSLRVVAIGDIELFEGNE